MSQKRSAKPRAKKSAAAVTASRKPAAPVKRPARAAVVEAVAAEETDETHGVMCRSCGKRPGRPTAILGQMTQAELCPQCTALRKERIRLNRAAARGLRSSRLF
jgi:NMD protein affecting ribosome stability and mRNA decay